MFRDRVLLGLFAIAVPGAAIAQRSGTGSGGTAGNRPANVTLAPGQVAQLAKREINPYDPVAYLMEKKKDLHLTPEQATQLAALAVSVKHIRDSLVTELDAAQKKGPSPASMAAAAAGPRPTAGSSLSSEASTKVLVEIREEFVHAAEQALGLLDQTQRAKAQMWLEKLNTDMQQSVLGKAGKGLSLR